jgi:peptide/nickel transport system permease protein
VTAQGFVKTPGFTRTSRFLRAPARLGKAGTAAAVVVAIAVLAALFGPWLAPDNPDLPDLQLAWVGPAPGHPLGFDFEGRDVLSRLLAGAQSAMLGPLVVVVLATAGGAAFALISSWRRGATDAVISSGMDVLFAFPGILLAVLAATVFGAGLVAATVALSIAYLPYVARVLRAGALRERNQPYVQALEVQGASVPRICLGHILPNMARLIVAQATVLFGYAMVDLAAISFLGLGVQPPAANWGVMISENEPGILQGYPLPALAAAACVVFVVIAVNVLGERLMESGRPL